MKMNGSYSAWKERVVVKQKFELSWKIIHHTNQYGIKMASKKDRLSETERFIELWQAEESLRNLLRRSSRSQMFFKIGVLKNFVIFTAKYLCWDLFSIKLQACRAATLLKRDSNRGVFLWAASFTEHLRWLLLIIRQIKDQARIGKKWWRNIKKKRFYSCINIYLLLLAQVRD